MSLTNIPTITKT